jgi:myo-inositol-1(or 4)-monophosphatase
MTIQDTVHTIQQALETAVVAVSPFVSGRVKAEHKSAGRGPVTEADRVLNRVLHEQLVRDGEGWLSEESVDDLSRLQQRRVWVVDPLDGTREFVEGIAEWSISVALVEDGRAIAGGICNPATREMFIGSKETGLSYNGKEARVSSRKSLAGATVLASRSEMNRGEWAPFRGSGFVIRPVGSVAYKLGLVAAGLADATWTLKPKNEWDVAAGVALVEAAGGFVQFLPGSQPAFNNRATRLAGLIACGPFLADEIRTRLGKAASVPAAEPKM